MIAKTYDTRGTKAAGRLAVNRSAERLRRVSPTAYPNRLMIRLADQALGRQGRMVRAIEAIGRGVVAGEAVPFAIAADLSLRG